jgi:hypothetical protein
MSFHLALAALCYHQIKVQLNSGKLSATCVLDHYWRVRFVHGCEDTKLFDRLLTSLREQNCTRTIFLLLFWGLIVVLVVTTVTLG